MFQTKVTEEIKTHILVSITFFKNRAVHEICGKILYRQAGRLQIKIRRKRTAKAHSGYVLLISLAL
jgi:hypothetical protein